LEIFNSIDNRIIKLIKTLQSSGYETYIVGGAVRDLLLDHTPKDYDISTSASPEQICKCLGRRNTMIIGKRFRLVHYRMGQEIIEISTFRANPSSDKQEKVRNKIKTLADKPENMIFDDNNFGTSKEDAFRRDFTVNALFYDPIAKKIIDHTGMGLKDIKNKVVRVIGDGYLRFEEDPVRMLRALKLVGQFGFSMDDHTENALFASLDKLQHVSISRMTLELEKILASCYGDKMLETFHDFGLLQYFLPFFDKNWGTPEMERALDLLCERNIRVSNDLYRNSISLAMATLLLPFAQSEYLNAKSANQAVKMHYITSELTNKAFKPQTMVKRLLLSAEKILNSHLSQKKPSYREKGNKHANELLNIIICCDKNR
jgi:poly(A) polymerase